MQILIYTKHGGWLVFLNFNMFNFDVLEDNLNPARENEVEKEF